MQPITEKIGSTFPVRIFTKDSLNKPGQISDRSRQLNKAILEIDDFPRELVVPTQMMAVTMEGGMLYSQIVPDQIAWKNLQKDGVLENLKSGVENSYHLVVISEDRMIGKFKFLEEGNGAVRSMIAVVDYSDPDMGPEVTYFDEKSTEKAKELMIKKLNELKSKGTEKVATITV